MNKVVGFGIEMTNRTCCFPAHGHPIQEEPTKLYVSCCFVAEMMNSSCMRPPWGENLCRPVQVLSREVAGWAENARASCEFEPKN